MNGRIDQEKGFIVTGPVEVLSLSGDPARGGDVAITHLDPAVEWNGGELDWPGKISDESYALRYLDGRRELESYSVQGGLDTESQTTEGVACLFELYRRNNVKVKVTAQAVWDFILSNIPKDQRGGMTVFQAQDVLQDPTWGQDRIKGERPAGSPGTSKENPRKTNSPNHEPEEVWFEKNDAFPNGAWFKNTRKSPDTSDAKLAEAKRIIKKLLDTKPLEGTAGASLRQWVAAAGKELAKVLALSLIVSVLLGCSALKTLWPGGVSAADAEWSGSKFSQAIAVSSLLDPRASLAIGGLTLITGKDDPFGVILPVTPVGSTVPRWVFCSAKLAPKCHAIPLNARVKVAGSPLPLARVLRVELLKLFPLLAEEMRNDLWSAKDISASDFDD